MQPLVSYNLGAGKVNRIRRFVKIGFFTIMAFTLIMYGFIFGKTDVLVHLFVHPSDMVLKKGIPAVRIYFLSLFFAMVNIYCSVFFQAVVKPKYAMIISLLRGFVLSILFVLVFPTFFGAGSIWWVMVFVEGCTMIVTLILFGKTNHSLYYE